MTTAIAIPEKNEKALGAVEQARSLVIASNYDYCAADAFCVSLKALEKEVDAAYDDHIDAAFKAHRALVAKKKIYAAPIEEARKIVKGKLLAWAEIQEKIRREDEARLQAEAKKRAEDAALAAAVEAEQSGDKAEAEAIMAEPVQVAPVVLAKSTPKAQTTVRKIKKFKIVDASKLPREYLTPDTVKIGGVVRALGLAANIPGIQVYEEAA